MRRVFWVGLLLLCFRCGVAEEGARFIAVRSFAGTTILSSNILGQEAPSNRLRSLILEVSRSRLSQEMETFYRRRSLSPNDDKGLIAGFLEANGGEVGRLQEAGAIGLTVRFRYDGSWSDGLFGFSRAEILDNRADVRWVDAVLPGDAFEDALGRITDLGRQRSEFVSAKPGFSHAVCYSFSGWGDKENAQSPYVLVVLPLGYPNHGLWTISGAVSFLVNAPWSTGAPGAHKP